jgi:rubrerythrin
VTQDLEDEPPEGGDAACWADRVCPECGQLAETAPPTRCPRCGHELDDR